MLCQLFDLDAWFNIAEYQIDLVLSVLYHYSKCFVVICYAVGWKLYKD